MIIKRSFIFLFLFLSFPLLIWGQDNYRVDLEKVPFPQLLDELEKSYNVSFSYPSDLLEEELFSLKTNTSDLSNILKEITALYSLEYQILENQSILLRDKLKPELDEGLGELTFKIVDANSNDPLSNVAVGILGTNKGKYSDEDGLVTLDIMSDNSSIVEIHLLGYKSIKLNPYQISGDTIGMTPLNFRVEEVLIKDRTDVTKIDPSSHFVELKTQHISAFASGLAGNDVFRQAQLLAGVSAFNDVSTGIKIRGAEEQSSLIVLDGIPIYNASHYYGLFSAINPSYSTSSVLYKNNLPVIYDGKTAGMLEIKGPEGQAERSVQGDIDINLLTLSGKVSLALSNNIVWTVAGRTSYQNVSETDFFSLFNSPEERSESVENFSLSSREKLLSSVPDFHFFDVNSKLQIKLRQHSLEFNYYQSGDDLDDIFENNFKTRRQRFEILNREYYNNSEDWENQGFNVKWDFNLSDNLDFSTIVYHTRYNNLSGLEIDLSREFPNESRSFSYNNFRENDISDIGFKSAVNYTTEELELSGGIELVDHTVAINVTEQGRSINQVNNEGMESSAFLSLRPQIDGPLSLELGFRGTLFNEIIYPSPRLNMAYETSEDWTLKASLGRHNQFVRQITFENIFGRSLDFWVLSKEDGIQVDKADQVMVGASFQQNRFNIDVETYYRYRHNLVELALFNPRFDETSILPLSDIDGNSYRPFTGNSQTYGIDITLSTTYPKYSGWLTYTLSKSDTRYDQILRGTAFPSQDDRRHQLKWINEYRIGNLGIGLNLLYASGRPYTDLNKVASQLRRDELRPQQRLSRLPAYFRTDLAATYKFKLPASEIEIGLSAFNLLDRKNVNYIQYLFSIPTNSTNNPNTTINTLLGTESNLLERTVNLNLKYSF